MSVYRAAGQYHGVVTLNGVDVSDLCAGVYVGSNGQPIAVRLYRLDDFGETYRARPGGPVATRIETGAITATLTRRTEPA